MSKTFGNKTTPYLGNEFTASLDSKNKWSGSDTFTAPFATVQNFLPAIGSSCTRLGWEFLTVEGFKIDNTYGELCTVTLNYTASNNGEGDFDFDTAPDGTFRYELVITLNAEPLITHPKYVEKVPAFEREQIKLILEDGYQRTADGSYVFQHPTTKDQKTIKSDMGKELVDFVVSGLDEYFVPKQIWRARFQDLKLPEAKFLNQVGYISEAKGAPEIALNRNWLFTGINASQEGKIFTIVYEWELSKPKGWVAAIYDKEEASPE